MKVVVAIVMCAAVLAACGSDGRSRIAVEKVEIARMSDALHVEAFLFGYDPSGAWTRFDVLDDNQTVASGRLEYAGERLSRIMNLRLGLASTRSYTYGGDELRSVRYENEFETRMQNMEYDGEGRLMRSAGSLYFYDDEDRLERVEPEPPAPGSSSQRPIWSFQYDDGEDHPARVDFGVDGFRDYTYDDNGALVNIRTPTGSGWDLEYNEDDHISRIVFTLDTFREVTTITYASFDVLGLSFAPNFELGMFFDLQGKFAHPDPLAFDFGDIPRL